MTDTASMPIHWVPERDGKVACGSRDSLIVVHDLPDMVGCVACIAAMSLRDLYRRHGYFLLTHFLGVKALEAV